MAKTIRVQNSNFKGQRLIIKTLNMQSSIFNY